MSVVKFLNWRPDLEDTEHDGLSVCQNVVHEPEGWKALHLLSAGAFATTGNLAASVATVQSIIAKPVGPSNDLFCAWVAGGNLNVGLNGVTATTSTTGYPLSFGTVGSSAAITAFDLCESYGKIYFVVEAAMSTTAPTSLLTLAFQGYMDY